MFLFRKAESVECVVWLISVSGRSVDTWHSVVVSVTKHLSLPTRYHWCQMVADDRSTLLWFRHLYCLCCVPGWTSVTSVYIHIAADLHSFCQLPTSISEHIYSTPFVPPSCLGRCEVNTCPHRVGFCEADIRRFFQDWKHVLSKTGDNVLTTVKVRGFFLPIHQVNSV